MITELGRKMNEHSKSFNKETENRKYQTEISELKNKLKYTLESLHQIK